MQKFLQQFFTEKSRALNAHIATLSSTFLYAIIQIKLCVIPTLRQRLGVDPVYNPELAYQKVNSRFDNYPIRAIIRDEYILNGQQRRPQRHPF